MVDYIEHSTHSSNSLPTMDTTSTPNLSIYLSIYLSTLSPAGRETSSVLPSFINSFSHGYIPELRYSDINIILCKKKFTLISFCFLYLNFSLILLVFHANINRVCYCIIYILFLFIYLSSSCHNPVIKSLIFVIYHIYLSIYNIIYL